MTTITAESIDALLPQTQCGDCGFLGCMPYAEALAEGTASIDRCPPGGVATIRALADLLCIDATPYLNSVSTNTRPPALAVIRESECIGCTKCIDACPIDAIIGSGKVMHAIIASECTGCGLCVEPCPVDCIELLPIDKPLYDKDIARKRFYAKKIRQLRQEHEQQQMYRDKKLLLTESMNQNKQHGQNGMQEKHAKQDYILQAVARVNAKKNK